jgi:RNA-directed DNA polymerase
VGKRKGIDNEILKQAVETAEHTLRSAFPGPPLLTLGHLAHQTGINVGYLRALVARDGDDPYRQFAMRKRPIVGEPPRYRFIAIPETKLMAVQKWIASEIVRDAPYHEASMAYAPGQRLVDAATHHCGAQWQIKVDVRDFFESISEMDVYRVFLERGYQPLVALELARICTRLRDDHRSGNGWRSKRWRANALRSNDVGPYWEQYMGGLPQGAPTSPMLANLAVRPLDEAITEIAKRFDVRYTRYADDLVFSSTKKSFGRTRATQLIGCIYGVLGAHGLTPNTAKTVVAPPGARKLVLGLLVDGNRPKLSRDFRGTLRVHLHYITQPKIGPINHAKKRGFSSVEGLRQHLLGLIAFAGQIDPYYADSCREKLNSADWPL